MSYRAPSVAEGNANKTRRERSGLVKERTDDINRIKALLALHGVTDNEPTGGLLHSNDTSIAA